MGSSWLTNGEARRPGVLRDSVGASERRHFGIHVIASCSRHKNRGRWGLGTRSGPIAE